MFQKSHNTNFGQRGTEVTIHLKSQYSARRSITSAKLRDLRNLCSYIPVEYRGFYTRLQLQPLSHGNSVKLCCHREARIKLLSQNLILKYHQVTVMMMNKVLQ